MIPVTGRSSMIATEEFLLLTNRSFKHRILKRQKGHLELLYAVRLCLCMLQHGNHGNGDQFVSGESSIELSLAAISIRNHALVVKFTSSYQMHLSKKHMIVIYSRSHFSRTILLVPIIYI